MIDDVRSHLAFIIGKKTDQCSLSHKLLFKCLILKYDARVFVG